MGGDAVFLLLWGLWVVFNGRLTLEVALFGAAIAGALYAAVCALFGLTPRREIAFLRRVPWAVRYIALLVREIFLANFQVLRFILLSKYEVEPRLVTFRTALRRPISRAMLANSITLTPGTITASVEGDRVTVHCLDSSLSDGLSGGAFERSLLEMEGDDK